MGNAQFVGGGHSRRSRPFLFPPLKGSAVRVFLLFAAGTADTISTL